MVLPKFLWDSAFVIPACPESFRRCLHISPSLRDSHVFDKFYLVLPAHVFYLLFSDYSTPAVTTKLIINKLMQIIPGCEAIRIDVVPMFIYSSYEVIRHPNVQSRSRIGHDIHGENILYHRAIISERFRASRNDIQTEAKRANTRYLMLPSF